MCIVKFRAELAIPLQSGVLGAVAAFFRRKAQGAMPEVEHVGLAQRTLIQGQNNQVALGDGGANCMPRLLAILSGSGNRKNKCQCKSKPLHASFQRTAPRAEA